jgi:hypothetical protein
LFTTTLMPAALACSARMVEDSTMPGRKLHVGSVKVSPRTPAALNSDLALSTSWSRLRSAA